MSMVKLFTWCKDRHQVLLQEQIVDLLLLNHKEEVLEDSEVWNKVMQCIWVQWHFLVT